jgi:hydroxyethylthiazole kinase-like uncharacterized protein yjeF
MIGPMPDVPTHRPAAAALPGGRSRPGAGPVQVVASASTGPSADRIVGGGARSGPWPLHEALAARAAEARALAASPPQALMARAGLAVARLALALVPRARRVVVLAGPGNNGGDGFVAASWLHAAGLQVTVQDAGDAARAPADAAWARAEAARAGVTVVPLEDGATAASAGDAEVAAERVAAGAIVSDALDATRPDLVIDALLGLGTERPPHGLPALGIALARRWRAAGVPVLAVDLPSGLHPDTGQPLGDAVVAADATLCLLSLKPGCFTGRGRDLAGTVWFDDLGQDPDQARAGATAWLAAPRRTAAAAHAAHK